MMKKILMFAAIFGLIFGVAGVLGYGMLHGSYSNETIDQTKTITAKGIDRININSHLSGVHISQTASDNITVRLHGGTPKKDIVFTAKANGDTATIEIRHQHDRMFNFFPFEFMGNRLKVELEVPKKIYKQLKVHSKAGGITVEDVSANQFDLHSSAGGILVQDLKGNVTAHSSAGSIMVNNIDGKLDLSDSAGSIDVNLKSIKHGIKAKSSAGSVRIEIQQEPKNLQFNLHTSAGSADVNLSNISFSINERDNIVGSIGSGGPTVQLQSSAGSVSINE